MKIFLSSKADRQLGRLPEKMYQVIVIILSVAHRKEAYR